MRLGPAIADMLQRQRGYLLPWVPVWLGAGIGLYFSLKFEPGAVEYAAAAAVFCCCTGLALRRRELAFLAWAPTLLAAGFCLGGARAHHIAAPVLDFRYYGPVEGRLVALDRSQTGALRMTLDQVRLADVPPRRTPARVRVSLMAADRLPVPGSRVMTTAHLLPPQGPAEPGGFDFRRHAWFQELGSLGYTRVPVLLAEPAGDALAVERLRHRIAKALQVRLPGEAGGFAAALMTGVRGGVPDPVLEALRHSNLAHLLAISGLHMGLLTGFVFAALRVALALVPPLALRLPGKKIAAVAALTAGSGYLMLSGGNVATERAFIMVAVMFAAVLLNRRAITLRAVAVAAVIVLLRRPESLLSPGFQMSFAATTALVAVFGWLREAEISLGPRWLRPVAALVISSAVAGLATAPVSAAHFNTLPHYGLLANLLAVPVMGSVVIPSAVLAACLLPFGLEGAALAVMRWGLEWILAVARSVSGLEGALSAVAAPGPRVLPLLAAGLLFLALWQGRMRLAGLLPAAAAFWLWQQAERPFLLIADTGGLVGVMGPEGRALSRAKSQGFTAGIWLENDGDFASQADAAGRWQAAGSGPAVWRGPAGQLVHAPGKRKLAAAGHCGPGDILVSTVTPESAFPQDGCLLLTPEDLIQTGSIAISAEGKLRTAREVSGARLWTAQGGARPAQKLPSVWPPAARLTAQ
ncbi:ComEC/Rec2 family competence protein [Cribrihabitans neustonicus]|uniref:ComEC/Rec2 family competence protein n=1 Tax=Cribrihabitans neustonicus TaxID=1429085 RepID=UPI003B594156